MKTVTTSKQSVAWFRLAECVDRGEKEKALAFHRLLTHSYSDHAFIKKLEADLLAFFQDTQASNAYEEAAILYTKQERFFEAALIYEYLLVVTAQDHIKISLYRQKAAELFAYLGHDDRVALHSRRF